MILDSSVVVAIVLGEPEADAHRQAALDAWWRFGRTRGSAALNFGDCIAYGTAGVEGEPLLFKGEDFTRTEIPPA